MDQYVYITGNSYTGIYKIGRSLYGDRRLESIKGSSNQKHDYNKVYAVTDMINSERSLHLKFKINRLNGEWFKLSESDLIWIDNNIHTYVHDSITTIRMPDFKKYIHINSHALIAANLSKSDAGRLLDMADMVDTEYNILFTKDSQPQNRHTLAIDLDLAPDNVTRLLNKFFKKGIIQYMKGMKDGHMIQTIILNPFIARNRTTINSKCVQVFEQFEYR